MRENGGENSTNLEDQEIQEPLGRTDEPGGTNFWIFYTFSTIFLTTLLALKLQPAYDNRTIQANILQDFVDRVYGQKLDGSEAVRDLWFEHQLLPRIALLTKSTERLLTKETADELSMIGNERLIKIETFSYCHMLNGSIFDRLAYLELDQALVGGAIDASGVSGFIDSAVQKLYEEMKDIQFEMNELRLACYWVADGANAWTNSTLHTNLLYTLDPIVYFKDAIPNLVPAVTFVSKRKAFKIAYTILIQKNHDIEQLKELLKLLDDGYACVLVQIGAGIADFVQIAELIDSRKGNVYLSAFRLPLIQSHISIAFAYLVGFFELRDLADWDYVINLSNYDWPLRKNEDIHSILGRNPGKSYFDYWPELNNVGKALISKLELNPAIPFTEFKSQSSRFAHWAIFRSPEYVVLTPNAVDFLRTDLYSLNYLALLEQTKSSPELYFATVLMNSPEQASLIVKSDRRFSHPADKHWLDWQDRIYIPPGLYYPQYLCIRPVRMTSATVHEKRLKTWIEWNHYHSYSLSNCVKFDLGYNERCHFQILTNLTTSKNIVLTPVDHYGFYLTKNLHCSLGRLGITNVLFWELEEASADQFRHEDYFVFADHEGAVQPSLLRGHSGFKRMGRKKPKMILKLLSAGFSVTYYDADTVAFGDIRSRLIEYTNSPIEADMILSKPFLDDFGTGVMHFQPTHGAIKFLTEVAEIIDTLLGIGEQDAFEIAIKSLDVKFTGYGQDFADEGQESKDSSDRIRIHYFDPFEVVDGLIYFNRRELLPPNFHSFKMVQTNGQEHPILSMKDKKLWFLDEEGVC